MNRYSCGTGTGQQWQFQDPDGYHRLVNRNSGKCPDVSDHSLASDARLLRWTCRPGANQQFQRTSVGAGRVWPQS